MKVWIVQCRTHADDGAPDTVEYSLYITADAANGAIRGMWEQTVDGGKRATIHLFAAELNEWDIRATYDIGAKR